MLNEALYTMRYPPILLPALGWASWILIHILNFIFELRSGEKKLSACSRRAPEPSASTTKGTRSRLPGGPSCLWTPSSTGSTLNRLTWWWQTSGVVSPHGYQNPVITTFRDSLHCNCGPAGEAKLAASVPNRVVSLDLVAANPSVIACNMAHTPLESQSVGCAVFCLSLMGVDYSDFLMEAQRTLKTKYPFTPLLPPALLPHCSATDREGGEGGQWVVGDSGGEEPAGPGQRGGHPKRLHSRGYGCWIQLAHAREA